MDILQAMDLLKEKMKIGVFATVDKQGKPHARYANIGLANDKGVFFMTSPKTNFYQQLAKCPFVAMTALAQSDYSLEVIRIEGKVRILGPDKLAEVLTGNPYIDQVYPNPEDQAMVQVFQIYSGELTYQNLSQASHHHFSFGMNEEDN